MPSRREMIRALGCCLAACGFPVSPASNAAFSGEGRAADFLEVDRLWDRACPQKVTERAYRVDAAVLLLGVPVLRSNGVGDARVALRQQPASDTSAESMIALEFAAASDPARAHGLDRMGWIREVIVEGNGAVQRAGVLGIMSDSPEQTAGEARTALRSNSGLERLVAIDSSHSASAGRRTRTRVIHFQAPRGNRTGGEGLPDLARQSFRSCATAWKVAEWPRSEGVPPTFLYALKRALEAGGPRAAEYIWNQSRYAMRLGREAGASASREFSAAVDRVHGELENLTQNLRPLRFQLWIDRESPVPMPLRIEFQPRSFLRLTLEAVNQPLSSQLKEKS
jgi:hypothetical protein